ncbi:hypothetical protein PLESTF_000838000 [Pleodorina starrii]|nr:hypothetical protein PLESTF_000838000 [Pleodorina starrii]
MQGGQRRNPCRPRPRPAPACVRVSLRVISKNLMDTAASTSTSTHPFDNVTAIGGKGLKPGSDSSPSRSAIGAMNQQPPTINRPSPPTYVNLSNELNLMKYPTNDPNEWQRHAQLRIVAAKRGAKVKNAMTPNVYHIVMVINGRM